MSIIIYLKMDDLNPIIYILLGLLTYLTLDTGLQIKHLRTT